MKKHLLVLSFLLFSGSALLASTTNVWRLSSFEDFKKDAKSSSVIIDSSGEMRRGAPFQSHKTDQIGIWSLAKQKNQLLIGTGNQGVILQKEGTELSTKFTSEDQLLITDMVKDTDGTVYAGTVPGKYQQTNKARIYRISPESGEVEPFAEIPDAYIWDLEIGKDSTIYAGTSPEGTIYRVSNEGEVELYMNTDQDHVMSLALDEEGNLFAGTGMSGILYRVTSKNEGRAVYNFEEQEVRVLQWNDGDLFVGANKMKNFRPQRFVRNLRKAVEKYQKGKQTKPALGQLMEGSVYRYSKGTIFPLHRFEKEYLVDMELNHEGNLLVASGERGRLISLEPETRTYEYLMDFESRQPQSILMDQNNELAYIGTANPGVLYNFQANQSESARYRSRVLDAKHHSSYGHVRLGTSGKGNLKVQTRTGNTRDPDENWSDWSEPLDHSGGEIKSPDGQYLQFRLIWPEESNVNVKWIHIPYLTENQQPYFSKVKVEEANVSAGYNGNQKQNQTVKIGWKVKDPGDDQLLYRLWARKINEEEWFSLTPNEGIQKNRFEWNTKYVENGWYEVKIEASDELENPRNRAHHTVTRTSPVLVDNERPQFETLKLKKRTIQGSLYDEDSPIARIEYRINGGKWRLVFPSDQIFDQNREQFSFTIPGNGNERKQISIRAFDTAGNAVVRQKVIPGE